MEIQQEGRDFPGTPGKQLGIRGASESESKGKLCKGITVHITPEPGLPEQHTNKVEQTVDLRAILQKLPDENSSSHSLTADCGSQRPTSEGINVEEAIRSALADVISTPITNLVMATITPLDGSGKNVAGEVQIDETSETWEVVFDPAKIPSAWVEKTVTHLMTPLATAAFGHVGLVIAIFIGNFAGELTHQVLDAGRDSARIHAAESSIELTGAFADARIGRLAESEPFSNYVSSLVGENIVAVFDKHTRSGSAVGRNAGWATGDLPTIKVVAAAYEVKTPQSRPDSVSHTGSTIVRIRPASFVVIECVPEKAVIKRWRLGVYEYLRLSDGTLLRRRIDGEQPRQWIKLTG